MAPDRLIRIRTTSSTHQVPPSVLSPGCTGTDQKPVYSESRATSEALSTPFPANLMMIGRLSTGERAICRSSRSTRRRLRPGGGFNTGRHHQRRRPSPAFPPPSHLRTLKKRNPSQPRSLSAASQNTATTWGTSPGR